MATFIIHQCDKGDCDIGQDIVIRATCLSHALQRAAAQLHPECDNVHIYTTHPTHEEDTECLTTPTS